MAREGSTPPSWFNSFMAWILRTPGLQRLVGGSLALITFEGRKTGTTYTTPVTYAEFDDTVVVLTKATRMWWRNLHEGAPVRLRLAGREVSGFARAAIGDEDDYAVVSEFLAHRRFDARAYGVRLGAHGRPVESSVRALLPHVVVVRIELSREPALTA